MYGLWGFEWVSQIPGNTLCRERIVKISTGWAVEGRIRSSHTPLATYWCILRDKIGKSYRWKVAGPFTLSLSSREENSGPLFHDYLSQCIDTGVSIGSFPFSLIERLLYLIMLVPESQLDLIN